MKRLIVAITGASGVIFGIRALEILREVSDVETHLIISPSGARTILEETDYSVKDVRELADHFYNPRDIGAAVSSGSFRTVGMLVAPCSIKTLSSIANSFNDDLVTRAADVCLKERRRVVLLVRETPLHGGHIALMDRADRNGAIIMPPLPAFYHGPRTISDILTQTIGRALDLFDIDTQLVKRWRDPGATAAAAAELANPEEEFPFWTFSLRFYERAPEVSQLLIALQVDGADVNLCLYLFYLASHVREIGSADVEHLQAAAAAWQAEIVRPLRGLRVRLKTAVGPLAAAEISALRDRIKESELAAERHEQLLLARSLPLAGAGTPVTSAVSAARANLAAYAKLLPSLRQDDLDRLLGFFQDFLGVGA